MNGDQSRASYFFIGAIVSLAVMIYYFESTLLFFIFAIIACALSFASVVFFSKYREEKKELES